MATPRKAAADLLPRGRPTSYDPGYCELVINYGGQGKSRAWIAAQLGVVPATVDNWEKAHPEFLGAMTRAKVLEQQWWEDVGQTCLVMEVGKSFSQSTWSRSMAARFPKDWREKTEQLHDATDKFAGLYGKLTPDVFPKKAENEDDGA